MLPPQGGFSSPFPALSVSDDDATQQTGEYPIENLKNKNSCVETV
jgi:hypothetical protein